VSAVAAGAPRGLGNGLTRRPPFFANLDVIEDNLNGRTLGGLSREP
jgi:hypothetical protein